MTVPAAPVPGNAVVDAATARRRLTELAAALGFDALAVARVAPLPPPHPAAYHAFTELGRAADMVYLFDQPEVRIDPATRWTWAQSVVVLAVHYDTGRAVTPVESATGYPQPPAVGGDPARPTVAQTVARYAQGRDYHRLLENALRLFKDAVMATPELGITQTHYHCDTGPVLERPWAHQAGLAWQAKHGLAIRPGHGSFFFLAEIFIDRALPPDAPATDHCGSCTRCIDICPTQAIVADHMLDARRCISWMNIEKREPLTPAQTTDLHGWLFGCDLCQNVCPHNTKIGLPADAASAPPQSGWPAQFATVPLDAPVTLPWYRNADRPLRRVLHPDLWRPTAALETLTWEQAGALTAGEFDALKQGTALRRVPYENFMVNVRAARAFWTATAEPGATPARTDLPPPGNTGARPRG